MIKKNKKYSNSFIALLFFTLIIIVTNNSYADFIKIAKIVSVSKIDNGTNISITDLYNGNIFISYPVYTKDTDYIHDTHITWLYVTDATGEQYKGAIIPGSEYCTNQKNHYLCNAISSFNSTRQNTFEELTFQASDYDYNVITMKSKVPDFTVYLAGDSTLKLQNNSRTRIEIKEIIPGRYITVASSANDLIIPVDGIVTVDVSVPNQPPIVGRFIDEIIINYTIDGKELSSEVTVECYRNTECDAAVDAKMREVLKDKTTVGEAEKNKEETVKKEIEKTERQCKEDKEKEIMQILETAKNNQKEALDQASIQAEKKKKEALDQASIQAEAHEKGALDQASIQAEVHEKKMLNESSIQCQQNMDMLLEQAQKNTTALQQKLDQCQDKGVEKQALLALPTIKIIDNLGKELKVLDKSLRLETYDLLLDTVRDLTTRGDLNETAVTRMKKNLDEIMNILKYQELRKQLGQTMINNSLSKNEEAELDDTLVSLGIEKNYKPIYWWNSYNHTKFNVTTTATTNQ
ncbi:hypothetical protein GAMM_140023 [Gammaproteobacteria bacterium]